MRSFFPVLHMEVVVGLEAAKKVVEGQSIQVLEIAREAVQEKKPFFVFPPEGVSVGRRYAINHKCGNLLFKTFFVQLSLFCL